MIYFLTSYKIHFSTNTRKLIYNLYYLLIFICIIVEFRMTDLLFLVCSLCSESLFKLFYYVPSEFFLFIFIKVISIDEMLDHSKHCKSAIENTRKVIDAV